MSTLRTHIINASNTKALPTARYHIQQHNSLPYVKKKHVDIQPLRYFNVTKNILLKVEKSPKPQTKITRLVQAAEDIWVKGHGTIERVDKKTGDIFHLVHKKSVYEQVLQEGDIDTNKKHKFYQSHLIRVKMPLKMNQVKPSEILPQESIISSPVKTDKNIPTLLEEETRITEPLPQKQKKPLVSIHSLIGATSKQTRKAVSIFRVIKKQPSSKKRLSLLRNFIS